MSKRGHYYDAPIVIKDVPGVTREPVDICIDEYSGDATALAAAGLLPIDLFPGMPGQNTTSAAWRPRGVKFEGWRTPGYLLVIRRMNGTYRAQLTVSDEEQDRRLEEKRIREAAADAAAEAVLQQLSGRMREYCESLVRTCGGHFCVVQRFRDSAFLAEYGIRPAVAEQVLHGLEVLAQAEDVRQIELSLSPASMVAAKALLDRVRA